MAHERKRVPLKWQKYLLLAHFGLTTRERLAREVRRYTIGERARLVEDLSRNLVAGDASNLYVVKLVCPDAAGQLPNYRVWKRADLPGLTLFLRDACKSSYTEAWCCSTCVATSRRSLAGRLAFLDGCDGPQTLEQVWRCSPRMLEEVTHAPNSRFNWPYMRACRVKWGWRFRVEHLSIPKDWPQSEGAVLAETREAMIMLDGTREPISIFADALATSGITCFSMEYKIVGSALWFIDWDTSDDRKAMRSFRDLPLLS